MSFGFSRESMPEPLKSMAQGDDLPRVFATLIGITLVMVLTRMWTGLWSNLDGLEGFKALFASPLFHFQVWVCFALPMYLMLSNETRRGVAWQVLSAILVLLGMAINRYEFIVGGQLVPMFKGNWVNSLNAYSPSATEWALTLMGWGIGFFLYALGERLFRLHAAPPVGERSPQAVVSSH
jgi:molybdopterin-containing oxidoreductase family membrane subunit